MRFLRYRESVPVQHFLCWKHIDACADALATTDLETKVVRLEPQDGGGSSNHPDVLDKNRVLAGRPDYCSPERLFRRQFMRDP